jgi:L-2-hydroxyglutarate oxidase
MKNITIIGAGIVGLATAYQIQKRNPDIKILILEKENDVARHQTGNNSGVIHSGIYYKPGSLKAKNCLRGYSMMIDFCNQNKIKYDLCGKVIVASDSDELPALQNLFDRGNENGLQGLKFLSPEELKEFEPHVNGIKGIFVPQTGIIDYIEVSKKLAEIIVQNGAEIRFGEKVVSIQKGMQVKITTTANQYFSDVLISCSGLFSDRIAKMTEEKIDVRIIPFRGEYYKLNQAKQHLVKSLIYPVPDPNFPFLGVHFTKQIDGGVEAGPNAVFAFKREGYKKSDFDFLDLYESLSWRGFQKVAFKYWQVGLGEFYRSYSKSAFVKALQKLIPEIQSEDLTEGGAGVRAQACSYDGKLVDDFYILEKENIFHVLNSPSPAATASLSVGEYISEKVFNQIKN